MKQLLRKSFWSSNRIKLFAPYCTSSGQINIYLEARYLSSWWLHDKQPLHAFWDEEEKGLVSFNVKHTESLNGLFTLRGNGTGTGTRKRTGTIGNNRSWSLSLSQISVNISTWYYTFYLEPVLVPVPFTCGLNIQLLWFAELYLTPENTSVWKWESAADPSTW